RGRWEVLRVEGTVAGRRESYSKPNLIVTVTDDTVNLPALTGLPDDPLNDLGAMPYAMDRPIGFGFGPVRPSSHLPRPIRDGSKTPPGAALETVLKAIAARQQHEKPLLADHIQYPRIDVEAGSEKKKTFRGIYRLDDDALTICYGKL